MIQSWCFSQTVPKVKINYPDTFYCWTAKELKSDIIPSLIKAEQTQKELLSCEGKISLLEQQSQSLSQQVNILEKEKSEQKKELSQCNEKSERDLKKINRMKFFNKVQNTTIAVLIIAGTILFFI